MTLVVILSHFLSTNYYYIHLQAASDKEKGGGAAKGGKGKDKPKSAAKGKGKGAKTPEPPSVKGPTKLKKRGEEDEKVYIGKRCQGASNSKIMI